MRKLLMLDAAGSQGDLRGWTCVPRFSTESDDDVAGRLPGVHLWDSASRIHYNAAAAGGTAQPIEALVRCTLGLLRRTGAERA